MGRSPDRRRNTVLVLIGLCCGMVPVLCDADYDPLSVSGDGQTRVIDLDVRDDARRRDIPVRCYLPNHDQSAPIILFSHGLGGSREGCTYLGKHWSARGYAVISLQHPGSDDSVWRNQPLARGMNAMKQAASARNRRQV